MKGIMPVIAVTLLVAITVIGAVTVWFWTAQYTTKQVIPETTHKTYTITKVYANSSNTGCSVLDIKNTGSAPIDNVLFEVREYLSGRPAGINGTDPIVLAYVNISSELRSGNTKSYNLSSIGLATNRTSVPAGTYRLRLSSQSQTKNLIEQTFTCSGVDVISGFYSIYLSTGENEKFSNTNCSPNLYVLENSYTKFFISTPNITSTDCSTPYPAYNQFAGTPMRIWTKDIPTSYRVNNIIIDDSYFYLTNGTTSTFYVNDLSQFNVSGNQIIVTPTLSPASVNFDAKVTYTIPPDHVNFVKITFWARNKNTSQQSVTFGWGGDQDPPSGTWYNETYGNCGICAGNTCTGTLYAKRWFAFARCGYNDVYGIIAPNTSVLRIWDSSQQEVRSQNYVVSAGGEIAFTFYIVSDVQGPVGQEWKAIEETYNYLYGT